IDRKSAHSSRRFEDDTLSRILRFPVRHLARESSRDVHSWEGMVMSANVRSGSCKLLLVVVALFVSQSLTAGDDVKSPSVDEKKAVALLVKKGSVIFIDGDYQVSQILGGRELTNDDLQLLRAFPKLKSVSLGNLKISEAALDSLKSLKQLQSLNLPVGAVSDQALQSLKTALPNCRILVPERRGFGPTGAGTTVAGTDSSKNVPGTPSRWGAFEFPPLTPAPSISVEIHSPVVQERLKLTADQKREIEKVTGRDFQRQQTETAVKKVLTAEQQNLMQQVLLQREGPTAISLPEVAKELKLTDEQKADVQRVMDERRDQLLAVGNQLRDRTLDFGRSMQETARIKSEANEKLLAVLTQKQVQVWSAKIGPPLPPNSPATFGGGLSSTQISAEAARSVFRNLDRNGDGELTNAEWQRSRTTRTKFENTKLKLEFPVDVENFVKLYLQLDSSAENRR
ncbi:MAG: hypothetical protein FD138_2036, partial [Planctomycetota bacterium]